MKLKNLFKDIINIFKSKDNKNTAKTNLVDFDNAALSNKNVHNEREEINFEQLKKISDPASINQGQRTDEKIVNNIIRNTMTESENIKSITIEELKNEINTIWDIIKIKENTQAEHITKSISADKWVTMDELRQNIKIQFNVEYVNEKSLYPYLKTLVDINLIKMNNIGKKRSWKKNIIIIENKS
jgi:hypothetical protein